jgi:hypothetical protein
MVIMRALLFALTVSFVPLTAAATSAEGPDVVSAIPDADVRSVAPGDLPMTFTVGGIAGTLTATSPSAVYMAGGSAFVQLALTSDDDSKSGAAAELRLEAKRGEIAAVTGQGLDEQTGEGARQIARIEGLRKGKTRTVLIEVRLHASGEQTPTGLRLSLRQTAGKAVATIGEPAGDAPQWSTAMSWPVAECGSRYQEALRTIGETGGNDLRKLWREAATPDASMPRRWLFKPDSPRRRARDEGDRSGSLPAREVRAIYQEASEVASTGYETLLRRNGRYDWILSKTSDDLGKYFSQEFKPAICTGAPGFAAYYEGKLVPLAKRRERLAAMAIQAERLARETAAAALESLRTLPGGHPAIGGTSLELMKPIDSKAGDLKSLVVALSEAGRVDAHGVGESRAAADGFAALKAIADSDMEDQELPGELRSELRAAFGSIEAALRLAAHRDRYERFWTGFYGKIQAIRDAHAQHCICSDKIASGSDETLERSGR